MFNIIIPTYKQKYLNATLDSIPLKYRNETIVVENGESLSQKLVESYRCNYIFVKDHGANKARNFGWKKSNREYILFTDDDIEFTPDYFSHLERIILDYKPNILGGRVELKGAEPWVVKSFSKMLAELKWEEWLPFGSDIMFLRRPDHYLVGANMCIKRSFLEKYNGFDENFGYKNNRIPNDEMNLLDSAQNFIYSPNLNVLHNIQDRCNIEYMIERFRGQGIADCRYYAQFETSKINFLKHRVCHIMEHNFKEGEIHIARSLIKNEDITEKFISHLISCKYAYIDSFLKEITNVYK